MTLYTQTGLNRPNFVFYSVLFSFASLSRIENISIICIEETSNKQTMEEAASNGRVYLQTTPSVRVHWVACGMCTVRDNFFQVGVSLRSHTRRGPLAHRSSHVRTTKQICPCVICSSNSARYCFGIVYHCSAMVEVLGK